MGKVAMKVAEDVGLPEVLPQQATEFNKGYKKFRIRSQVRYKYD
jgi:hypothetical protein